MNEKRLNEIHARLEGATPTDLEPTFRDEVWFIRHIEEIIKAYRQDIPDLLDEIYSLRQQNAQLFEALNPLAMLDLTETLESKPDNIPIFALNNSIITVGMVHKARAAIAAVEIIK